GTSKNMSTSGFDSTFIANNMIMMKGSGSIGIYNYYGYGYVNIYYNTVLMNSTTGSTGYALEIESYITTPHVMVYNNILDNRGGGYALYVAYKNYGLLASDYNELYTTGTNLGYINSTAYKTLKTWQTASGWDTNSVVNDPTFVSLSDLHLKNAVSKKGIPLYTIKDDFDGKNRNSSAPDFGAHEFAAVYTNDIGVSSILSPANNSCADSNAVVKIIITNNGNAAQTGFTVYFSMDGGTPLSATYSNTLAVSGTDTITFATRINTYPAGTKNQRAYTALTTDANHANDTFSASITIKGKSKAGFKIGASPLCVGQPISFTDTNTTQITNWIWNFGDPASTSNTSTSQSPSHAFSVAGIYNIRLKTTTTCNTDSAILKIKINPLPNAIFSFKILDTAARKVRFMPLDSSSSLTYNWAFGDGNSDTIAKHPIHIYSANNLYISTLNVTDAMGCSSSSADTLNLIITDINPIKNPTDFKLSFSPNPFINTFNITYQLPNPTNIQIQLFDANGKYITTLLPQHLQPKGQYNLHLPMAQYQLQKGIYFIHLLMDNKCVNYKVVKIE
ncbi:MAG: PKD domain-containing protein, partial [Bacteroidetes bacterium]|nr:PKD domain-containing protein [Bacteroidota bacterium]